MTPPFNVLAYLLLPVYHYTKDKERLARFNDVVCRVTYTPFAIIFTTIFLTGSLVMTPLAWMKALWRHLKQICKACDKQSIGDIIFYIVLGLPWFILMAIVDTFWFLRHQYLVKKTKTLAALSYPKIHLSSFNKFYHTVSRL